MVGRVEPGRSGTTRRVVRLCVAGVRKGATMETTTAIVAAAWAAAATRRGFIGLLLQLVVRDLGICLHLVGPVYAVAVELWIVGGILTCERVLRRAHPEPLGPFESGNGLIRRSSGLACVPDFADVQCKEFADFDPFLPRHH